MTLTASLGLARDAEPGLAIEVAAAAAREAAGHQLPRAALVLTAGGGYAAAPGALSEAVGGMPLVGGSVPAILTDAGILRSGAAVLYFLGGALAPGVASGGRAAGLSPATERVGRLILSGARDRRHYPRGFALAFARPTAGSFSTEFLPRWRQLAGPKMRTVVSATTSNALYISGAEDPGDLAVLALEGAYPSGVGITSGLQAGGGMPLPPTLVHGAGDAAATAVKQLDGQAPRVALIAESERRHLSLGEAAQDEWLVMRERIGLDVPCLGWLTSAEAGCARGIAAAGDAGSVIIAALGDPPAAASRQAA
jgi:hypothetical protein